MKSSQQEAEIALAEYREEKNKKSVKQENGTVLSHELNSESQDVAAAYLEQEYSKRESARPALADGAKWKVGPRPLDVLAGPQVPGFEIVSEHDAGWVAIAQSREVGARIVSDHNSHATLVAERDMLLKTLETRAEREMEMLEGVARENDKLREVILKHSTQLEWALGFNENGSLSPHGVAYVLEAQRELTTALADGVKEQTK